MTILSAAGLGEGLHRFVGGEVGDAAEVVDFDRHWEEADSCQHYDGPSAPVRQRHVVPIFQHTTLHIRTVTGVQRVAVGVACEYVVSDMTLPDAL